MGRQRSFDTEAAIASATKLFWRGYEQTSLTDLTSALQIAPASLYFAFGSKEELFREVVRRYVAVRDEALDRAFDTPTLAAGVAAMLRSYVDVLTDPGHVPGCLLVNSTLAGTGEDDLQRWLVAHRAAVRRRLEDRFAAEVKMGTVSSDLDCQELAGYVVTVAGGLAIEAKSGVPRDALLRTVAIAMESVEKRVGDQRAS